MSLFGTNFRTQVFNYLPPVLRETSFVSYLYSLVSPVESKINSDVAFEAKIRDESRYNGQKILMQAGLNEIFGIAISPFILVETNRSVVGAGLIVDESELIDPALIMDEGEGLDTFLVLDESEDSGFSERLRVKIPVSLSTPDFDNRVEAEMLRLKSVGVTYTIETYV